MRYESGRAPSASRAATTASRAPSGTKVIMQPPPPAPQSLLACAPARCAAAIEPDRIGPAVERGIVVLLAGGDPDVLRLEVGGAVDQALRSHRCPIEGIQCPTQADQERRAGAQT